MYCLINNRDFHKGGYCIKADFFLWQDWGMTEQHNAMVFDAETVQSPDGTEETKVQFLNNVQSFTCQECQTSKFKKNPKSHFVKY